MKKIGMVLVLCLCGSSAFANSNASLQIRTVKNFYNQCTAYENENDRNRDNPYYTSKDCREILYKLASNDFKKAMKLADEYSTNNDGFPCDYLNLVIWGTQDPYYNTKRIFTNLPNNKVKAQLETGYDFGGYYSVTYALSCDKNKCQITDILQGNESQKKAIFKECR